MEREAEADRELEIRRRPAVEGREWCIGTGDWLSCVHDRKGRSGVRLPHEYQQSSSGFPFKCGI